MTSAHERDALRLADRVEACRREPSRWSGPGIEWTEQSTAFVRSRRAGTSGACVVLALDPPNVVEQASPIIERLVPNFRVLAFEQPGFGFSFPKPGFGFRVADYESFLEEFLDRQGLGPYVLAFPCISVYYGLRLAGRRPDLVDRALFLQAASWREQRRWARFVADVFTFVNLGLPGGRFLMRVPGVGQALGRAMEGGFVKRTQPRVVFGGKVRPELVASFVEPAQRAADQGGCNCMPSFYQRYFGERDVVLPVLERPVHLAWAIRDVSHRRTDRRGLVERFPDAVVTEHDACGHHLDMEQPDLLASLVRGLAARP